MKCRALLWIYYCSGRVEIRRQIGTTCVSNHAVGPEVRVPALLINTFFISSTVTSVLTIIPCVSFMIISWNIYNYYPCWVAVTFWSLSSLEAEHNTCLKYIYKYIYNIEEEVRPAVLHSAKTTTGAAGALGELSAVLILWLAPVHMSLALILPSLAPASDVYL